MSANAWCAPEITESELFTDLGVGSAALIPTVVTPVDAMAVQTVAESAEAVVEALDAPRAAAPALWTTDTPPISDASPATASESGARPVSLDEYAKAVLYNGLGHFRAACVAARRACENDDFDLLDGALAELIEGCVRSGSHEEARTAIARLEARSHAAGTRWQAGIAACSRALLSDGDDAERHYQAAIEYLRGTRARVALGRAHLLYGEWLRRQGRRVDGRGHLTIARDLFLEFGLDGFTQRAHRELLATGHSARRRTDDTRFHLTAREEQIARLAAERLTNPEIGEQLFLSSRTVEWHLGRIFMKLGISSRRELSTILHMASPMPA